MVGSGFDPFVEIRPERQYLAAPGALHGKFNGGKGRVLDKDAALFNRGAQPENPVIIPPQYGGKEFDQGFARDRAALVIPGAVPGDADVEIADRRHVSVPWRLVSGHGKPYLCPQ